MPSQQKLLRIFRLIRLLNTRPYKTIPQFATLLDITIRSVYRYIDLLEEIGYLIDKDESNRYFILQAIDQKRDHFLETDEAYFLQDLLQQAAPEHPLAHRITGKLNEIHTLIPLADSLPQVQSYENVKMLSTAIQSGHQVLLQNYHSASSQTMADRRVEPIMLSEDYQYLVGYDLDNAQRRQFKIERIDRVQLTDSPVRSQHPIEPIDIFGFTGPEWIPVRLRLSAMAYRLLREEFPRAQPLLRSEEEQYLFEGQVRDLRGIGRFILGLPGEVDVLEPAALLRFLQKESQKSSWLNP